MFTMHYLKHKQECFIRYKTRAQLECFISDKARTANVLDGLKNYPTDTIRTSTSRANVLRRSPCILQVVVCLSIQGFLVLDIFNSTIATPAKTVQNYVYIA